MKADSLFAPSLSAAVVAFTFNALAFRAPDLAPMPNLDNRLAAAASRPKAAQVQAAAAGKLRSVLPGAKIDFDEVTGAAKFVTSAEGFLTGPNGSGKAVAASAAALFAADPFGPTKAFIQSHTELFGFGPDLLDKAVLKRDSTTPHNGVRTVIWQQQLGGVPVFQATLVSHTTRRGELINLSTGFVPDPESAARAASPDPAAWAAEPTITAAQAVALAAQNIGEQTQPEAVQPRAGMTNLDSAKRQQFHGPGLSGEADASLVWVPMDRHSLRLAWEIVLTSRSRSEMFRLLIDAETGAPLIRHCLTEYLADATYRVYTSDSPSPFSPGWSSPNSTQPPLIPRQLVTLSALDLTASPAGWIPDTGNETLGNNVDAHTDTNADNVVDLPRPQASPDRVFDFPIDESVQQPGDYAPAAVVQLFYLNNWVHDKLYQLGFTEAAGNFQTDNFGRGGAGNDAVQADAQDASGIDNANFSTPSDGSPPRMQMFIWANPTPRRDGDLDAEIVVHEYVHGLSNRHVNGGTGLSAPQSRGMGEGWSDFYALALLSEPGDDVNGCFAAGAYSSHKLGGANDTQNYYFGIRRYPYCTDMTKNPLTFNDIDPAQANYCASGAPYHSAMFGSCSALLADEVHAQGEVWCMALWEARARLVSRDGWAAGNQLILQLVTDGMRFSPSNPNFLQARDAILQADLVNNEGANQPELWAAFAKRGMGFTATSPSSSTVSGVHESFDLPDDLRISPVAGFTSSGPEGGPFDVSFQTMSLTNFGANPISWTLTNSPDWLTVSPDSGVLNPREPAANLTVTLNNTANLLPPGLYRATLLFSNLTTQVSQTRSFLLRIGQPDYFTELFEANDNDLAYSTLTFTPDPGASSYVACHEPASSFYVDPAGGNVVSLGDDSFAQVVLDGPAVTLYGNSSGTFFIGSNGYLTMNSGDESWTESPNAHFSRPRIAALFHDQLPIDKTVISWKQLSDRVAVTYQDLADIMRNGVNNFQIEWFYDGRIRITYLGITNRQNLVGLSAGTGLPPGFIEMDLSEAGSCNPIRLTLPSAATEGDGVLTNVAQVGLSVAMPTNVVVQLSSSQPLEITVPESVIVPAGQTTASFDVTIVDDLVLDGTQRAAVTASAAGFRKDAGMIVVNDNETAVLGLVLPPLLVEGQGSAPAMVTLSSSPASVAVVSLSSSDTNRLLVPPFLFLPAGQTSALFTITVVDNFRENPVEQVSIIAQVHNWQDASNAVSVLDNPTPLFSAGNGALISVPDGPASPYPSPLSVSGLSGVVAKVTVVVSNIFHTYPDDLALLLVGPDGTNVILMSNAGGEAPIAGVTLTFDDSAAAPVLDNGPVDSGTYLPTPILPGTWPLPAPAAPRGASLAAFNGSNPNGTWLLYAYDDSGGDSGKINNGWQLSIRTSSAAPSQPLLLAPVVSGSQINLSFSTVPAHTYFIEYADDASSASWLPLASVPGDGTLKVVSDVIAGAQRLYRLRVQ